MKTTLKTTLNFHDALLMRAKIVAARQNMSLTRLIEEGLQLRLQAASPRRGPAPRALPVFRGKGGLVAGLTGSSNKAMLDAADT